ncbi:MAG TPA: ATP-binding protein, partial [Pyrinomonadaceae bacterium]
KSSCEIVKEYGDDLPTIFASSGKLQQVFTNLILNARDAMIAGGTITLRTGVDAVGDLLVEVADTGEGIPEENLSKVFDPFFTTKGVGNGTGLGLAVTYGIVQEHSGTIEVHSKEGRGTTFKLVFPPAKAENIRAALN